MIAVQVKFTEWGKIYDFDNQGIEFKKDDYAIVETDLGLEIGQVVGTDNDFEGEFGETEGEMECEGKILKKIVRKADANDLKKLPSQTEKKEALNFCQRMIEKHDLPMKLVGVNFSFDNSRVTFAFSAEGRVDFRELVKELTYHFNKSIRLNQIGTRDEAKTMGDCGPCGKSLCCKKFIKDFSSITSEMAETQQVVHRGSSRISGICGRLMCCLAYEQQGYEEMCKKLPAVGTRVNVDGKRGVIVGHHVLKQSVDVEFDADKDGNAMVMEVDLNRHSKKDKKR